MQQHLDRIVTINLIFSTLIFYVAARVYILPKIKALKPQVIMLPILLLPKGKENFHHEGTKARSRS